MKGPHRAMAPPYTHSVCVCVCSLQAQQLEDSIGKCEKELKGLKSLYEK